MSSKITGPTLFLLFASLNLFGQEQERKIELRSVLHAPINQTVQFFAKAEGGEIANLPLVAEGLSQKQTVTLTDGAIVLYNSATPDQKVPEANVLAKAAVPKGMKQAIMVLIASPSKAKSPYRAVLIDSSAAAFPKGESRILSLLAIDGAVEAGEHKVKITPGEVARLPEVKKVNEYNMAQTNFYYDKKGSWVMFTERQLQYLEAYRRVFLVYATPGTKQPFVKTILDVAPTPMPTSQ